MCLCVCVVSSSQTAHQIQEFREVSEGDKVVPHLPAIVTMWKGALIVDIVGAIGPRITMETNLCARLRNFLGSSLRWDDSS